jgi:hypothetical protein
LQHKDTELNSGVIHVDFNTNMLYAYGIKSDTSQSGWEQSPVLVDKGQDYRGTEITYNFQTARGIIDYAGTESDEGFYSGTKIKKVDEKTFFVQEGFYTTCEDKDPHYGFFCLEMKVIPDDQVVAKWIWLTFGGVPFPVPLPFAVFPLETGRRSGLIAPVFGTDNRWGSYFKRTGYFWAINDYMDLTLTGDYYTRGGFGTDGRFRYNKRYNFEGSFDGGYSLKHQGEDSDADRSEQEDWRINWRHNHTLSPSSRIDVNLQFMSSNFFQENSVNYDNLLRNNIVSNATFYKNWDESGMSLRANYSRNQELQSGNITEILPSVSFNKSVFYPFRKKGAVGEEAWYEKVGFNYSAELRNRRQSQGGDLNVRGGIKHSFSTSASPKIGYITVSPSISYEERWYSKRINRAFEQSPETGELSLVTNDVDEINMIRTFSLGTSANTKIYGMFPVNSIGIEAFRHIISPSLSFSYQPDFSSDFWGYYDSYKDTTGEIIYYDKFQREIYGGVSRGERKILSFSVGNVFEMKTMEDLTDTTSQQDKFQLLNLSARISYDFAADSLNFSDIGISYRTSISDWVNLSGNATYSLYDYDVDGRTIDKFLLDEGKGIARLRNFGFSLSTSLSGEKFQSKQKPSQQEGEQLPEENVSEEVVYEGGQNNLYQSIYGDKDPDFTIPWSVNLSYNYNFSRSNPLNPFRSSTVSGSMNMNITKNWKITVSGSYDLVREEFAAPRIMISRDLHCWMMNFTWNPVGTYRGYQFEIKVKAPHLQDLKVEKSDSFFSGR